MCTYLQGQLNALKADPIDCEALSALVDGRDCCAFADFPDSWTMLHFAARDAAAFVVQSLINGGHDIEAAASDESRPIHMAGKSGNEQAIVVLANAGADVEAQDNFGSTALHLAVNFQKLKAIKALAEIGADVDGREGTINQWAPLHRAAFWGDDATVRLLAELCADVDATDARGKTPLHVAVEKGNLQTALTLVDFGANCTIKDNDGNVALENRCSLLDLNIHEFLQIHLTFQRLTPSNAPC